MMRGLLSGIFWGALFGGIGLAVLSTLLPLPETPPGEAEVEVPAESEFNRTKPEQTLLLPQEDTIRPPQAVRAVETPTIQRINDLSDNVTRPAGLPEAGLEVPHVAAPTAAAALPSLPRAGRSAPMAFGATGIDSLAPQPDAPLAPDVTIPPAMQAQRSESADMIIPKPSGPRWAVPRVRPLTSTPFAPEVPTVATEPPGRAPTTAEGAALAARPSGNAPEETVTDALVRFAQTFANPDDKPLFSVILIDRPNHPSARDGLLGLDFPITVAIDPARDDAAAAAAAYRRAGHEVLIMADALSERVPSGGIKAALEAFRTSLPQAVALLDKTDGDPLQTDQALIGPILGSLAASGHGFLTYDRGSNGIVERAMRDGVVTGLIFRPLDAER
ncbi:MAG: divergent polysaccharide deacetylase family protein, partial [Pseudomonadota bacterium]